MFLETILQKICLYHLGVTEFVLIHPKSKENSKNIYQCTQGFDNRVRCKFVFVVYLFLFLFQDKKDKRTTLHTRRNQVFGPYLQIAPQEKTMSAAK